LLEMLKNLLRGIAPSVHKRTAMKFCKGIDLEVQDGEFVIFVGPPAAASRRCCASSPAWRMPPPAGAASTATEVTVTPPAKRGIAMVFQSYALYPHLTVKDNMGLGLKQAGTA
jgi:multiple sugar transport system ATP-binding protein